MEIVGHEEALAQAVRSHQIVLVQFGSERCAPCKAIQNRLVDWNQENPAACYAYVTVEELPQMCAQMGVFTVPTIFVYVEGKLTIRQSGYFSLDQILEKVEKYAQMLSPRLLRTAFLQYDVSHWKEQNFRRIEGLFQTFDGDLAVLPELSLCGYLFPDRKTLMEAAEPVPDGPSVRRMQELSAQKSCIVVFGLAEKEGNQVYNTAVVVSSGRYLGKYRKIHLSDLEKTLFAAGTSNAVIDAGTVKLGVQICFDLWFPEISREQLGQGAELFCALANFGGETTARIAQIRAIENQTPMVLCNRVGTEKTAEIDAFFLGKSAIWSASGEQCGSCIENAELMGCGTVEIGGSHGNLICRDFDAERRRHPLTADPADPN